MIRISRTGHLVKILNKETRREENLFLYITGAEPRGAYKAVIKGIRDLDLPPFLMKKTELRADAVDDFSLVEQRLSRIIESRIYRLPIMAFYDREKKAFKESLFLGGVSNVIEKEGTFFPTNRLTAVATGSDFFNRENIIKKLWDHFACRESVYLHGPRRYGKTSILKQIEGMAFSSPYRPVMFDLESVTGPKEFLARLVSEIEGGDLPELEKEEKCFSLADSWGDPWMKQGFATLKKILIKQAPHLIILDEWPYMLDTFLCKEEGGQERDREKTIEFVNTFRKMRSSLKGHDLFFFSGSIDLQVYLRDNGLKREAFSDLKEVRVDYFDRKSIRDYLESLLLGQEIVLSEKVLQLLAKLALPGIPYFIQILDNRVFSLFQKNPRFTIQDLQKAYETITGPEGRRYFDIFERHFKCYGPRKPGARAGLKALSKSGERGLTKEDLRRIYNASDSPSPVTVREFNILLSYLEHDFFIERVKETGRYRFASPMLRDYWRKNQ